MKLKKLAKIQLVIDIVLYIMSIPFLICHLFLFYGNKPFEFVLDYFISIRQKFGNFLLRKSDEVKNGIIKNSYTIKSYTARFAHKELKRTNYNIKNE